MAYAHFLSLPSAFPLRDAEQSRRAWISRSLICLGLCLVLVTTISLAPVGELSRNLSAGLQMHFERREAVAAQPREGQDEYPQSQSDKSHQVQHLANVLPHNWDGSQQDLVTDSPSTPVAKPESSPIPIRREADYPSLDPNIAGQLPDAKVANVDSAWFVSKEAPSDEVTTTRTRAEISLPSTESSILAALPSSSELTKDLSLSNGNQELRSGDSPWMKYPLPPSENGEEEGAATASRAHHINSEQNMSNEPLKEAGTTGETSDSDQRANQYAQCPTCPTCPACPLPNEVAQVGAGGVDGPCSGQGFKCDECLNGWFCPPQETPAQVLQCGLGWPCFHCSSGSFCIPETAPASQAQQPPVPEPAIEPFSTVQQGSTAPINISPVAPKVSVSSNSLNEPAGIQDGQLWPPIVSGGHPSPPLGQDEPLNPDSSLLNSGDVSQQDQSPNLNDPDAILSPPSATNGAVYVPSLVTPIDESLQGNHLWKYVGCFKDDVLRALLGAHPLDYLRGNMSPVLCVAHCETLGLPMAGVENGQECWCGQTIRGDAIRLPESCCEMPCQGNPEATCGGDWAVGVFLRAGLGDTAPSEADAQP